VAAGVLLGQPDVTRVGILLLTSTALALMLVRRHGLRLEVERGVSPVRVAVDERSVVTVRIRNGEATASPVIMAEESIDYALGDPPRFIVPTLRSGMTHDVQYSVRPPARGAYRLGPLTARVRDPFGLSLRATAVGGDAELVVLPRVVPLASGHPLGGGVGPDGTVPHHVAIGGEDDQVVREYRDGDDLRRIHWPATARTGDLMVRHEERPSRRRAVVVLDSRRSSHRGSGRTGSFEWAVTAVASILHHVAGSGQVSHLLTADPDSESGVRHDDELGSALDTLARAVLGDDDGVRALLPAAGALASSSGLVTYVGGPLTDDDTRALAGLRRLGASGIALVLDAASFGTRGEPGGPSPQVAATVAELRTSGWSAVTVQRDTALTAAWSAVTTGHRAVAR
jgi:uncharacterized protein (DUF58 family)